MRVESSDLESAVLAAKKLPYLSVKNISSRIHTSSLGSDNKADRMLRENNYRSQDLYQITKDLKLDRPDSQRMIFRLLRRGDLMAIIHLLTKSQIIASLRYLDKSRLIRLMFLLPRKYLFRMLLSAFRIEDIVKMMPFREMKNILRNHRLDNNAFVKIFSHMDPRFLKLLLSKILGQQQIQGLKFAELLSVMKKLKKRQIVMGMEKMPYKLLVPFFILAFKMDPQLMTGLSDNFLAKMFNQLSKGQLLRTLEEEVPRDMIIDKFMTQLSQGNLMQAASHVDGSTLAQYLIAEQPNLLLSLAMGMAA